MQILSHVTSHDQPLESTWARAHDGREAAGEKNGGSGKGGKRSLEMTVTHLGARGQGGSREDSGKGGKAEHVSVLLHVQALSPRRRNKDGGAQHQSPKPARLWMMEKK